MDIRRITSDIARVARRSLRPDERVGLALGVFDFCHEGHVNLLRRAARGCDRLVVGVHTDAEVERYKGVRPMNTALERAERLRATGLADVVEIDSDRERLCRRHGVDVVYHGDDWDHNTYMDHFGRRRAEALGVEIELLPHTPGVDSSRLRDATPRVGWWLYSKVEQWDRSHVFDHLDHVYDHVGGVWIVGDSGRTIVKEHHPEAPCAWMPAGTSFDEVCRHVAALELDVLVTAHFNHAPLVEALQERGCPVSLVVLSHGRSGKAGTSADVRRREGRVEHDAIVEKRGCVTIHDWSYAPDAYGHLDAFLATGGSFVNPPPRHARPRLLVLPTWGPEADARGLLMSRRWRRTLRRLSRDWDVVISPHPLGDRWALRKLAWGSRCRALPARGRSFAAVPLADAVLCDLSGVFWEALLFDTPVLLAAPEESVTWGADLAPSPAEVDAVVPTVSPADAASILEAVAGERAPAQRALGEARLGVIDGGATRRVADRIVELLPAAGEGQVV